MNDYDHFKDTTPVETIRHARQILNELGLVVQESEVLKSTLGTYSLRLTIQGTNIGTNGKGVAREYALASAYAEFMERLQNHHLNTYLSSFAEVESASRPIIALDEQWMTWDELIANWKTTIERIGSAFNTENVGEKDALPRLLTRLDQVRYDADNDRLLALPFYSALREEVVFLPYSLYRPIYGSNGMCAGNTPYEALVQGFSEIFERYVQRTIQLLHVCLPHVPLKDLEMYPEVISYIERCNSLGIDCQVLDASLGGKYPVMAVLCIVQDSGRFGFKLGSHPNRRVAIERCFTEMAQGQDVTDFASASYLDFENTGVGDSDNVCRGFINGEAQYPYELFLDKPDYAYCEWGLNRKSNRDYLLEMMDILIRDNREVLIRDSSIFGFPAFQIIVPGISEISFSINQDLHVLRNANKCISMIREPETIRADDVDVLIEYIDFFEGRPLSFLACIETPVDCPYSNYGFDGQYFAASMLLRHGRFEEAVAKLLELSAAASFMDDTDRAWLMCLTYFANGMAIGKSAGEVISVLKKMFNRIFIDRLTPWTNTPELIISDQYANLTETASNSSEIDLEALYLSALRMSEFGNISQEQLQKLFRENDK